MTFATRRQLLAAIALKPLLGSGFALAQAFPTRPIRMIVPFPAGGSVDQVARGVAESMSKTLGQPVVIDNKAGANAAIGATEVARSGADGYTLLFGSDSGLVLSPLLYKKLAYDVERDFTAVGVAVDVPLVITVHPDVPATTVAELITYAKANPRKLNYGSTGTGSIYHLTSELFCQRAGIEMTHIPYTGGAPALNALVAHQVDVFISAIGTPLQFIRAGKLRPLAVLTRDPVPALQGVPTLAKSGITGVEATSRYGIVAPKKTDPAIISRLNQALNVALAAPRFRERFIGEGFAVPTGQSAADFERSMAKDRAMWRVVIAEKGLTLE